MYEIRFSKATSTFLEKLKDKVLKQRILKSIAELVVNPYPNDCKFLKGENKKIRIRVGKYRIIYSIIEADLVILIIDIDKRSRVYEK